MRASWFARRRGAFALLALVLTCGLANPAWAAGGAHVVDDSEVETAGTCHVESWVTLTGPSEGLVNASPACTRTVWPNLELGGALSHGLGAGGETIAGATVKWAARRPEADPGLGLAAAASIGARSGRIEGASLIAPVTLKLSPWLKVNFNAGWSYSRALDGHALFAGAQAELAVSNEFGLMVEAMARDGLRPGGQMGLRWTPGGGPVDLDLLVGQRTDGAAPRAVTVGLTRRF
jgi:hypothetical protein